MIVIFLRAEMRALLMLLLCAAGGMAVAQSYPARPVRIVVAFPAGGGNDIIARFFSAMSSMRWPFRQVPMPRRAGRSARRDSNCPSPSSPPSKARRLRAAWSWRCGATSA